MRYFHVAVVSCLNAGKMSERKLMGNSLDEGDTDASHHSVKKVNHLCSVLQFGQLQVYLLLMFEARPHSICDISLHTKTS